MAREKFYPKLRTIRRESGLSIRQLASETSVDRTKISRWERGDGTRMIREAIKVAKALNTTVEELFSRDNPPVVS